jgi:Ion channel
VFKELKHFVRRYFSPHRHTALLVAIISAFAVRPLFGDVGDAPLFFSLVMVLLLLVALYNINVDEMVGERGSLLAQAKRRRIVGWVLALGAIAERLSLFFVKSRVLNIVGSIGWLLFLLFVTISELRGVLKQRQVTAETISMAMSIYLLLAVTWGFLYIIIFQLQPGSFSSLALPPSAQPSDIQRIFPVLGYYSLGTISTIGAGDITPVSLQARYATVAEAITGQFYLAILVARLVSLQMGQSASRGAENQSSDS